MDQTPPAPTSAKPSNHLLNVVDLFKASRDLVMSRWQFFFTLSLIPSAFFYLKILTFATRYSAIWLSTIFWVLQILTSMLTCAAIVAALQNQSMNDWKAAYRSVKEKVRANLLPAGIAIGLGVVALMFMRLPTYLFALINILAVLYAGLGGKEAIAELKRLKPAIMKNWQRLSLQLGSLLLALYIVYRILILIVILIKPSLIYGAFVTMLFLIVAWPFIFAYFYLVHKQLSNPRT